MDLLRIQLISGEELTLSAAEISDLVETPGLLSVKALKQCLSWTTGQQVTSNTALHILQMENV